jgi:hypothetical protein
MSSEDDRSRRRGRGQSWSTKIIRIWLCWCIRRWKLESGGGSWLGIVSVYVRVEVVFKPSFVREFIKKTRARIFNLLRDPRMDSKEPIPPAYVAWRAGTLTLYSYSVPDLFAPFILFGLGLTVVKDAPLVAG